MSITLRCATCGDVVGSQDSRLGAMGNKPTWHGKCPGKSLHPKAIITDTPKLFIPDLFDRRIENQNTRRISHVVVYKGWNRTLAKLYVKMFGSGSYSGYCAGVWNRFDCPSMFPEYTAYYVTNPDSEWPNYRVYLGYHLTQKDAEKHLADNLHIYNTGPYGPVASDPR